MTPMQVGDIVRVNTPQGYLWGQVVSQSSATWWLVQCIGKRTAKLFHRDALLIIYSPSYGEKVR